MDNGRWQWNLGDAAVQALKSLGIDDIQVRSYEERSMSASQAGGNAQACAFIELSAPQTRSEVYGVGIDENIITASIKALMSAINRNRFFDQLMKKSA